MIKLKPGFHIIATIAVIAAVTEKKELQRSQRSYETTLQRPQRSQRQQSLRHKKFYLSDPCHCDHSDRSDPVWKPGFTYRNNHPPFLLDCYLYTLQTYETHSSKLWLLLVITIILSKQEGCIMLFTFSCLNYRNDKGLLNFVSERINLVYGLTILNTTSKKISCLSNI